MEWKQVLFLVAKVPSLWGLAHSVAHWQLCSEPWMSIALYIRPLRPHHSRHKVSRVSRYFLPLVCFPRTSISTRQHPYSFHPLQQTVHSAAHLVAASGLVSDLVSHLSICTAAAGGKSKPEQIAPCVVPWGLSLLFTPFYPFAAVPSPSAGPYLIAADY